MRPQPWYFRNIALCSFRSSVRVHRRLTRALSLLIGVALTVGQSAWAQDPGPSAADLSAVFPKAAYSPFANRNFPTLS